MLNGLAGMTLNMTIMSDTRKSISEKIQLRDYFSSFISDRRFALFNRVIRNRTRYICLVLEDIYQPHNASAVLRSCDCFGVQDIHIIENQNLYEVNPDVALGSSQWLTIKKYNGNVDNTESCLTQLIKDGYRIVATTPREDAVQLDEFDVTAGKFALLFGTEKDGLTANAMQIAKESVRIPMIGFTESFNISVSAALCLYHFTTALRKQDVKWELSEDEMLDVQLEWFRSTLKDSQKLEEWFYNKK